MDRELFRVTQSGNIAAVQAALEAGGNVNSKHDNVCPSSSLFSLFSHFRLSRWDFLQQEI